MTNNIQNPIILPFNLEQYMMHTPLHGALIDLIYINTYAPKESPTNDILQQNISLVILYLNFTYIN